ncbi:MAG: extracellular solute-binding protein [Corallococcus sp.]|nr:extracellular solute-binding protein [Corallococcus sp.]
MKKFGKTLSLILCFALLFSVAFTLISCKKADSAETDELVVYNWADYIYDYKDDFQKYYRELTGKNINITYVTFDTNETMLTRVMKGDSNVDVICPSEYAIQKLMESDMLLPMNYFDETEYTRDIESTDYVHNGDNVDVNVRNKIAEGFGEISINGETVSMLDYMVPYMYGTLGILYNKYAFKKMGIYDVDKLNKANWGILFNDDGDGNILSEELTGSILMKDSIRDSYAATVFYLLERGKLDGLTYRDENSASYGKLYTEMSAGELINAVDEQLISLCRETLTAQKSQLFGYEVDFGKDDLLQGNALVDLAWSGDAMYAVEESWSDYLCPVCADETGVKQGTEEDDEIVCSVCGGECGDYELSYYMPNNEGNIWFDGWVIPKTCNPDHLESIKIFINFLNSPYVAAENMLEIGYSSAVSPEAVRYDSQARSVLAEAYNVNDDSWDCEGTAKFDYDSWEEFADEYFAYADEIDGSNWRYPFETESGDGEYNRSLSTLGVMRDFGANNKQVVTMWNYARSAGVTALPLLLWTLLAVAVIAGTVVLWEFIKLRKNSVVIIKNRNDE